MMPDTIHRVFFIGIGGIGMSALARYFRSVGVEVFGYDRTSTALTRTLEAEGMTIHYEDDITLLPENVDLVVYTPAIPKEHKELNYYLSEGLPVLKRSEVLQELTRQKYTIAVAGSHGKTTVSSMIAHVLNRSDKGCTAFLGGLMLNYGSNFISSNPDIVVVEADEFDRSFLRLDPDVALITAVDTDHLDIYGSREHIESAFIDFTHKVKEGGKVVLHDAVTIQDRVEGDIETYGEAAGDTYRLSDLQIIDSKYHFTVTEADASYTYTLGMGGRHNVLNATAAISVARGLGIDPQVISDALQSFKGIRRRFEYVVNTDELVYIDDYAHHPEEIKALMAAVKELYPDKHITAIFQPHLFSRTYDLHEGFAESLEPADSIIVMPIYPARELPKEGVTADLILNKINNPNKKLVSAEQMQAELAGRNDIEVLLTIGAGDIDKQVPVIKALLHPENNTAS